MHLRDELNNSVKVSCNVVEKYNMEKGTIGIISTEGIYYYIGVCYIDATCSFCNILRRKRKDEMCRKIQPNL